MKQKNFVRHTRPHGKNEIKQTIRDIKKQIKYLQSIGGDEYEINYYRDQLKWLNQRKV